MAELRRGVCYAVVMAGAVENVTPLEIRAQGCRDVQRELMGCSPTSGSSLCDHRPVEDEHPQAEVRGLAYWRWLGLMNRVAEILERKLNVDWGGSITLDQSIKLFAATQRVYDNIRPPR